MWGNAEMGWQFRTLPRRSCLLATSVVFGASWPPGATVALRCPLVSRINARCSTKGVTGGQNGTNMLRICLFEIAMDRRSRRCLKTSRGGERRHPIG